MPNYKQTDVIGQQWQRANRIVIENPYQGVPSVMFAEEKVTVLPDSVINIPQSNLYVKFDPSAIIDLVNPDTGESLGQSMTHLQLYLGLHSLYMQKVQERDTVTLPEEPVDTGV